MNLTPQAYKRMVRITQAVNDYHAWEKDVTKRFVFTGKWRNACKLAEKEGIRYQYLFYFALREVAEGNINGKYAKAFA
jgi:hypothetical protein